MIVIQIVESIVSRLEATLGILVFHVSSLFHTMILLQPLVALDHLRLYAMKSKARARARRYSMLVVRRGSGRGSFSARRHQDRATITVRLGYGSM